MTGETETILLVEDDQNDIFFLQLAFEAAGIKNPVQVLRDGQQAVDYLAGSGQYADRTRFPLPCLILLDLKLPGRMGLEILRWIRQKSELQTLVVLVLTSSSDIQDIDEAYRLGARAYLVKPLSVDKRLELAKAIKTFWLELAERPSPGGSVRRNKSGGAV